MIKQESKVQAGPVGQERRHGSAAKTVQEFLFLGRCRECRQQDNCYNDNPFHTLLLLINLQEAKMRRTDGLF